ncbi:hypothetical protein BGZ70_006017 [Mortierella alpina]|uniref:Uncharacterized protein n=1 Tax=Mortierella alpina TaxID=64518 RepID=A0A9P6JDZ4_MORAP|nr:hypothetical protein BGZ70_006017 [Mortierella alpina]
MRRDDHAADVESQKDAYSLRNKVPTQDFLVESVAGNDDIVMRGGSGGTESVSVVKLKTDVDDDGGRPSGNISKSVVRAASSEAAHLAPLDAHHGRLALIMGGLSALLIFVAQ